MNMIHINLYSFKASLLALDIFYKALLDLKKKIIIFFFHQICFKSRRKKQFLFNK